jgi:hypothetical protein
VFIFSGYLLSLDLLRSGRFRSREAASNGESHASLARRSSGESEPTAR